MRPKRILGYCRVSSEMQARGTSLGDQQAAIETYAKARGLSVARFFIEAESSVRERIESRHQMQALLKSVRAGDLVLCHNLDRWSRDPEFTFKSLREIVEAGAGFYSVGDGCDPATSEGDTMLNFRVLFAREEHKRIKARMVGTRQVLRAQGYYVEGLPPIGYARAHPKGYKGVEKNVLVIVPAAAAKVRKAFAMARRGIGLTAIAEELRDYDKSQVNRILRNRHYIGQVSFEGQWIPGKHPPLIDVPTFEAVQRGLTERRHGGPRPSGHQGRTATWILRDVAVCGICGARMTARYSAVVSYYMCRKYKTCGAKAARVDHVEAFAGDMVEARIQELREELSRAPESAERAIPQDYASQKARLAQRRERFVEAFADGHLTREALREKLAKLDADTLTLEAREAAETAPSRLKNTLVRREALRELASLKLAWGGASAQLRRKMVRIVAVTAAIKKDHPPVITWRDAEDLLVSS